MKRKTAIMMVFAAVIAAQYLTAQTPAENGFGIGQKMKQNSEALTHYSYKRRTEIKLKDQSRGARVDLVRYVDGKMETVPIEAPSRQSSGRGGLRGRMMQKKVEEKKEEMKSEMERLTALLHSYTSPGSNSMSSILDKATISRIGSGPEADVKLAATGLKSPSDSFTLVWSVANHRPVSVEIRASLDGKPVQLDLEYAALPDGTFYPAHTVISAPKKDLKITIDSFDYTPAA